MLPKVKPAYVNTGMFSQRMFVAFVSFVIAMMIFAFYSIFIPHESPAQSTPTVVSDQTCLTIKSNRDLGHQYSGVAFNVCIPDDQVRHLHDVWWDQHNRWVNK